MIGSICGKCQIGNTQQQKKLQVNFDSLQEKKLQPFKIKLIKGLCLEKLILNNFVFKPIRSNYQFPKKYYKILKTTKSHIPLVYFPKLFPSSSSILIYSHGSGSNLNNVYQFASRLYKLYNIAVIAYDYTGYGESKYQNINYQADIQAILAWVVQLGYDLKRCILTGFSLGTYSTLYLNGDMPRVLIAPICGIIPFIEQEIAHYGGEIYDNIELAKKCNSRVFMIHSVQDKIPVQHSQILYKALISNRSEIQSKRICYIELNQLKHGEMIEFLIIQQNHEFKKFLKKVNQDADEIKNSEDTQLLLQKLTGITYEIQ